MRKIIKVILVGLGMLIILLVIIAATLGFIGGRRVNNQPPVTVASVNLPTDEASLTRGAYLAQISSCTACHGADLAGDVLIDEPPIGYLPAPNLTAGAGGIGGDYHPEDWARAIRHGIAADNRAISVMPSNHYAHYGDEDLGALIAYLESVPPVDKELGQRDLMFIANILFGVVGYEDTFAVSKIDHDDVGGAAPAAGETAAYGEYLVNIASCNSCHGENLTGATDPNGPQGPDITTRGALQTWSKDDFIATLRTGQTPDGRQLDPDMPWGTYAQMSDAELTAIWLYINALENVLVQ